jgi:hypothetical protein
LHETRRATIPATHVHWRRIDREEKNAKSFICFHLECTQDDLIQCENGYKPDLYGKCTNSLKSGCGNYEPTPNLCVVQKVCTSYIDKTNDCELCGQREYICAGENTLTVFCEWLFLEDNYPATSLCHKAMTPIPCYSTSIRMQLYPQ